MGIGMGELGANQKYVVVIEVFGPRSKGTGDKFDRTLAQIQRRFDSQVVWSAHADKNLKSDPKGATLPRRRKRKAKGKASRPRRRKG